MKLQELIERQSTFTIVVGYDDHMSIFELPVAAAQTLLKMSDADDINTFITSNGEYVGGDNEAEHSGDVFFDLANQDIDELHTQLKSTI